MYVAFRIWNSYLLAREPRDRNAACDRFMDKMSRLTGVFQNETMSLSLIHISSAGICAGSM